MKLILLLFLNSAFSLQVFYSILPTNNTYQISGMKYQPENQKNVSFTNNLSFCARFNYRILNKLLFRTFSQSRSENSFIYIKIGYPQTFFSIGDRINGNNSFDSWALKDPKTNEFNIWFAYKWHHICLAYHSGSSHVAFVKVSM